MPGVAASAFSVPWLVVDVVHAHIDGCVSCPLLRLSETGAFDLYIRIP